MAEVPEWFPSTMEELYRLNPGEAPSLSDPRVASSHGGGWCPVQHWGVLTDGRVFYFRYRHGCASVALGPDWFEAEFLPAFDPRTTMEEWNVAYAAGARDGDLPNLWLSKAFGFQVTEEDDGFFDSQEDLDETFTKCLDLCWDKPLPEMEGWEVLRQTDWRKTQKV